MNDCQIDDLKQFNAAAVSWATSSMATKYDILSVKTDVNRSEVKIVDLTSSVAIALDSHS
jgi:uncharacterized protein YajQ (UPF0234 family)